MKRKTKHFQRILIY